MVKKIIKKKKNLLKVKNYQVELECNFTHKYYTNFHYNYTLITVTLDISNAIIIFLNIYAATYEILPKLHPLKSCIKSKNNNIWIMNTAIITKQPLHKYI